MSNPSAPQKLNSQGHQRSGLPRLVLLEVRALAFLVVEVEVAVAEQQVEPPVDPPVEGHDRVVDDVGAAGPDVAFYLSEEARLARLPRFQLNASVGGSAALSDAIISLGAGLFAPLYAGGALAAQVEAANADQEAAIAAYGAALLRVFEEVEAALANEALFAEREGFIGQSVEDYRRAYEFSKDQYDVGQIDLLSVLQFQSRWLGSRVGLIRVRNERLARRVNLHLALGGSFEESREE